MELFYRQWPINTPKAAILIVHGIAEHSGRYEHVAKFFNDAGLSVYALDLPGHGHSEGKHLDIESTDLFRDAVEQAINELILPLNLPWGIYGHSMGGLITTGYLCDKSRQLPNFAILSAPALQANVPVFLQWLATGMYYLKPDFRKKMPLTGQQLSTDPKVAQAYFADPLIKLDVTVRLAKLMKDDQKQTRAALKNLPNIPIYVLHGEADTLVPLTASTLFLPFKNVTRVTYPGMAHECHNELNKEKVLQDILNWLNQLTLKSLPY